MEKLFSAVKHTNLYGLKIHPGHLFHPLKGIKCYKWHCNSELHNASSLLSLLYWSIDQSYWLWPGQELFIAVVSPSACVMLISPIFQTPSISRCPRRVSVAIDLVLHSQKGSELHAWSHYPALLHIKSLEITRSIWLGLYFERYDCTYKYAQNTWWGPLNHKGRSFPLLATIFDGDEECVYSSSQKRTWFALF